MKTIFKIARTELQKLFYSPVAWLILVIFAFQVALGFTGIFERFVRQQSLGWSLYALTPNTFGGMMGMFTNVQTYLYLYIPLLTMGVMSREYGNGGIKLLYSSPLTNYQIILGKYLSLMIFGLVLMLILGVFSAYAAITIEHRDLPLILCGMLGLYLLICAYAAVGLFMSSLTSYTVVAAMGTLATLAVLNYVKTVGQEIEFVRDITYWLAISGRADTFIAGMITSEDLLYFLVVICMFIAFTILKLHTGRVRSTWIANFGRYATVFVIAMLIGYFSSKPKLMGYLDVTRTKTNTLNRASQDIVAKLDGGLTVTTYTNMLEENAYSALPSSYKWDVSYNFGRYIRFKPDIKMKYIYYYHKAKNEHLDKQYPTLNDKERMDTLQKIQDFRFPILPYSAISGQVNLQPEMFRFVRLLERENGQKTFLRIFDDPQRFPSEAEVSAAFKRLTEKLPTVGFLGGHGERESNNPFDRGYKMFAQEKTFRHALINQGFDFTDIVLNQPIPDSIRILMIAEPKRVLNDDEKKILQQYIDRGGNMLIAGEPGRQEVMNSFTEQFGVSFLKGTLVKPSEKYQPQLLTLKPTKAATKFSYYFDYMLKREALLTMPTSGGLQIDSSKGFKVTTLFTSDSTGSWNETETTDFVDDSAVFNPAVEKMEPIPTVAALSRTINGKEQKILVTGDADWLSNGELGMSRKDLPAGNFYLINGGFSWLSDGEVPIDMRRPPMPDKALKVGESGWKLSDIFLKWVFPAVLAVCGLLIWIRRRGR
ncbi:Gldg family protein [Pseudobacter ginsenosidimutans]|uniref:ABC-2 type transport system permease protein n=1 Tax=Pseudobacter ginsenosidimutans TaxID=661488 RepID=A0A4Q7MUQ5_9BACT|nr:Gldg family protein [Pseudobacter ginsenosidimutans]QEC40635.1 ABC transporter permease subunit [Pseudobacter ginsenosidimutans]RZS72646.1 ABC-2 type transport system permease protein [Pseudobacter ginsenosidimutans]